MSLLGGPGERGLDPGLCRGCADGRAITSARGAVFWRCGAHDRDPRIPKYPNLPVLRCPYYRPRLKPGGGGENARG